MMDSIEPSQNGEAPLDARTRGLGACAPQPVWEQISTGDLSSALSDEDVLEHFLHASRCAECGSLLADAIAMRAAEATADEEALLEQLETSSAAGQFRLATRLHDETVPRRVPSGRSWTRPMLVWSLSALGTAAVAAVAFVGFQMLRAPSDARLLVAAYDKHRTSELRIPGGAAVPLASPTRGARDSDVDSSELLKVKLHAQLNFERTPNDPRVRQTLGEIAIVEHNPEAARRSFEMADALDPNLPRLKFDLGTAYFELAEANDQPLDYARALDFFLQYSQEVHQQDAVALFDVGLCWEREAVVSEAVRSFEAALTLEKDPGWRVEIQRHLDRLKAMAGLEVSPETLEATLTPEHFLSLDKESPGEYELYLDAASRKWLPLRDGKPVIDAALGKLAAWGTSHDDRWLSDMLRAPPTPDERAAEQTLAEAIQANAGGNAEAAVGASARALRQFQRTHNRAGELRAQAEHIYSLARFGEFQRAMQEAQPVLASGATEAYLPIQVLDALEASVCGFALGRMPPEEQLAKLRASIELADKLPNAKIRAVSFAVDYSGRLEHYGTAWSLGISGLRESAGVLGTDVRRYQLIYNLEQIARGLQLRWVEAGLASAAAEAAAHVTYRDVVAYSLALLGSIQTSLGEQAEAAISFNRAETLIAGMGQGTGASRSLGRIYVREEALNEKVRGVRFAIQEMEKLRDVFDSYHEPDVQLRYYDEYSRLLLDAHEVAAALSMAWRAVEIAEMSLAGLRDEGDRRSWIERTKHPYEQLVLCLIQSGREELALRAWEWRQTATFRRPGIAKVEASPSTMEGTFPELPTMPAGTTTIVVARLEDTYFEWSISGGPQPAVRMHEIAMTSAPLLREAEAFQQFCRDPLSSRADLSTLGSRLYDSLIGPFDSEVDGATRVRFDLDRSIAPLPMAALIRGGRYVGLTHAVVYLRPDWSLVPGNRDVDRLPAHPHLMMVEDASSESGERIPEDYNEANEIAREFTGARVELASIVRSGPTLRIEGEAGLQSELARTEIFHYAGHWQDRKDAGGWSNPGGRLPGAEFLPGSMAKLRLAVLAACRTAGEREESAKDVPSFARVLMTAGAKTVLASTWDVDSVATRKLMIAFYRGLAGGQPFVESLRLAQASVAGESATAHPYFWASFQLIEQ